MIDKISIVTTTYNTMPFLKESVESILGQTFSRFEFLIVNDGSIDGTRAYLASLSDARIRILDFPENRGRSAALNLAISEARYDWIAMQDADDVALPQRLEKEIDFLNRNPQYILVSCGWGYIGANGRQFRAKHIPRFRSPPTYDPMIDGAITNTGSLFRRDAVIAVGGYRDLVAEDLDLWLRLAEASYRMASLPKILMLCRTLPGGITSKNFIEQRLSWEYSFACSNARRTGSNEPCLKEFVQKKWPSGLKRINLEGQRQFRLAGASWGSNFHFIAAVRLCISLLLNPWYVVRKFRIYFYT